MIRHLLFALTLLQLPPSAAADQNSFFRYRRSIRVAAAGQTCAVLDAAIFAHTQPFLKDLRLYASDANSVHEIPYVITLSEAQQSESEPARILNLGTRGNAITFDLAMPNRPYTEVVLDLAGHDFLATASVTGIPAPGSSQGTRLGDFNLFDLTSQHLSRSMALDLQESSFPFLHISLTASVAGGSHFRLTPQILHGASVPPSREAQTLFTVAAQTSIFQQHGSETVAHLSLPRQVPIERVSFAIEPAFHANFSRVVVVSSHIEGSPRDSGDSVSGTIQRVRISKAGREISDRQLTIPSTLGANLQNDAEVDIDVKNGDDSPLPLSSVQLEMRQRNLCFQAVTSRSGNAQQFTLFYGDSKLAAPVYDLARTYTPGARSATAQLGLEDRNPAWHPRSDERPYTERHPQLLWIALLCVVCVLALVAFRSSKDRLHPHR